jgi:hypothetical protein
VANAVAGDTVWVKAGNYFVGNLVFANSGTEDAPIVFIGYKDHPGDIDSTDMPTSVPAYLTGGYGGNSARFPTINGQDRATAGLAMQLYGRHHIVLRNFHITNYTHGIGTWNSGHLRFENIICAYIGNIYDPDGYSGVAMSISNTSNSTARHCFVYNSAAEGINIASTSAAPARYNLVDHCYVFCDDTTKVGLPGGPTAASTDYYFVLAGTGSHHTEHNVISNCHIGRIGDVGHGGHGIAVVNYDHEPGNDSGRTRYNTIRNCTSTGVRALFHLRGKDTEHNTFSQCTGLAAHGEPGGVHITCARYNTFDKIVVDMPADSVENYYLRQPVMFYKNTAYSPGHPLSAVGNVFTNCLFNAPGGVGFGYYVDGTSAWSVDSNRFVNCTFANLDPSAASAFILAQRANQGNSFENCIISGFQHYLAPQSSYAAALDYANCCFHGNGFAQGGMTGASFADCLFDDPLFVDAPTGDLRLQAGSPCVDAGRPVPLDDDLDGAPRPCNDAFDIGAFEFQGNCAPVTAATEIARDRPEPIVHPNPATGIVHIHGVQPDVLEIVIGTLHGAEVARQRGRNTIDISGLAPGPYLLFIHAGDQRYTHKLIKQ